jgi:hypothetical protein
VVLQAGQMMLVEAMNKWELAMSNFGLKMSFKEISLIINEIANAIVSMIYGKETKEEKNRRFQEWFNGNGNGQIRDSGLEEFKEFAEEHGIDTENLEQTVKNIYRNLTKILHPDLSPVEHKKEKENKFKELQDIWGRVPEKYKVANSWYINHLIFSAKKYTSKG